RDAGLAHAGLAGLGAVAGVAVAAGGAVRDRGVLAADDRITGVEGARVAVVADQVGAGAADARVTLLAAVARVGVEARGPVGHRGVRAAGGGIARVVGTGVVVVAVRGRAGLTDAVLAQLDPVARVVVGARGAVRQHGVLAARHRVARVRRT